MKKVLVTGGTNGIGGALCKLLKDDYEVIPMDVHTGHSFASEAVLQEVYETALTCDIFINNLFHHESQLSLFKKVYAAWKEDPNKHIININSKLRLKIPRGPHDIVANNPYTDLKKRLHDEWINVLHETGRRVKISNVSPGFVDTKFSEQNKLPEGMKLEPEEVADYIKWTLDQPDFIELGEVSFWRVKR
jgi:NADP-dependent 3-hydroxy acid dehydrogenase YdfG